MAPSCGAPCSSNFQCVFSCPVCHSAPDRGSFCAGNNRTSSSVVPPTVCTVTASHWIGRIGLTTGRPICEMTHRHMADTTWAPMEATTTGVLCRSNTIQNFRQNCSLQSSLQFILRSFLWIKSKWQFTGRRIKRTSFLLYLSITILWTAPFHSTVGSKWQCQSLTSFHLVFQAVTRLELKGIYATGVGEFWLDQLQFVWCQLLFDVYASNRSADSITHVGET